MTDPWDTYLATLTRLADVLQVLQSEMGRVLSDEMVSVDNAHQAFLISKTELRNAEIDTEEALFEAKTWLALIGLEAEVPEKVRPSEEEKNTYGVDDLHAQVAKIKNAVLKEQEKVGPRFTQVHASTSKKSLRNRKRMGCLSIPITTLGFALVIGGLLTSLSL